VINLGYVLEQLGRHEDALRIYLGALGTNPPSPILHNNLGTIYHKLGKPREGDEHYRRSDELAGQRSGQKRPM
jgi:tetratricopeptide (TPR) repeat protein